MTSDILTIDCTNSVSAGCLVLHETVDRVILRLNALCRKATLEFAVSVGRAIIEDLYGGNLDAWRSRGPKTSSFRKLAIHPDLPMSPGALYRSVAMYEMSQRFDIKKWRHVSTSHLRVVLPLPADEQARILSAAESGKWPVSRLSEEVAARRSMLPPPIRSRGGRRPKSRFRNTIVDLERSLNAASQFLVADERSIDPTPESARNIIDTLERVRQICDLVEKRVAAYTRGARTIPPPPVALALGDDEMELAPPRRCASDNRES